MKNKITMFTSIGILAAVFIGLMVSFTPKSPASSGDFAIMRLYESADDKASMLIVSYNNFQHKEIELWGDHASLERLGLLQYQDW